MSQEILNILLSALGIIVTGIASFLVAKLTQWINSKISNKKIQGSVEVIGSIVLNVVKETYQTFVESLKKEGKFDAEAQKEALNKSLLNIKSQLSVELVKFIQDSFGDVDVYLTSLIEGTIYSLKN